MFVLYDPYSLSASNEYRYVAEERIALSVPRPAAVSLISDLAGPANVELDWYFAHRAGTPMMQSFIVLTAQRHTLRPATASHTRGDALPRP